MAERLQRTLPTRNQLKPLPDGIVVLLQTRHLILADRPYVPYAAYDAVIELGIADAFRIIHRVLQGVGRAPRVGDRLIQIFPAPHHQRALGASTKHFHLAHRRFDGAKQKFAASRLLQSLVPPQLEGSAPAASS